MVYMCHKDLGLMYFSFDGRSSHLIITPFSFLVGMVAIGHSIQFNSIQFINPNTHTHIIITNIPQYNSPYV